MGQVDTRLDRMIEMADETGYTLDQIVAAIGRVDQRDFARVSGNVSLLPLYMKSKDKP